MSYGRWVRGEGGLVEVEEVSGLWGGGLVTRAIYVEVEWVSELWEVG